MTDRRHLIDGLRELGLEPVPGDAPYVLVEVGCAPTVTAALLERGILVRDTTSFGLPRHIRIAARPAGETDRLLDALRDCRS